MDNKTAYSIGDIKIPVVKSERPIRKGPLYNAIVGFGSLLKGMRITAGYFFNPKEIVTQQYPENRSSLEVAERFRAELKLKTDENGFLNCTGCKICAQNCPNASIEVIDMKGFLKKKEINRYIWHMDSCTFCNICVQVCPFDALEMKNTFESSAFDRRLYTYQLNLYAGPTQKNLAKVDDESERKRITNLVVRAPYEGPVPLGERLGVEAAPIVAAEEEAKK